MHCVCTSIYTNKRMGVHSPAVLWAEPLRERWTQAEESNQAPKPQASAIRWSTAHSGESSPRSQYPADRCSPTTATPVRFYSTINHHKIKHSVKFQNIPIWSELYISKSDNIPPVAVSCHQIAFWHIQDTGFITETEVHDTQLLLEDRLHTPWQDTSCFSCIYLH